MRVPADFFANWFKMRGRSFLWREEDVSPFGILLAEPNMAGNCRLAQGRVLLGKSGLMRATRWQHPRQVCYFASSPLAADSKLRRVRGLRHSSAWFGAARPSRRQGLDGPHASSWGER